MRLLALMYHRASAGQFGNSPDVLDAHFGYIAERYQNVLPGDVLTPDRLNVCLTFDDGYFDFHAIVFPLLRKHKLRAQLAIAPRVIRDLVDGARDERLRLESERAFLIPDRGGFCTWAELNQLTSSGHVRIAAHGLTHRRLDDEDADLDAEVDQPAEILRSRTGQAIDSFVFPFGRYSAAALQRARSRYRHVFRIGGALNHSWAARVLYRVDADRMETPTSLFAPGRLTAYRARYFWNRFRGR